MSPILPDQLGPGLRVVFCGSAAGRKSAEVGAYYAGPGNRFWPTLHEIGLTPRQLVPTEFRDVMQFGIGLTDIVKTASGGDHELAPGDFDADGLRAKILRHAPRVLAFNGKRSAKEFFATATVDYGQQREPLGDTALFVLPSTSGAARAHWNIAHWRALAAFLAGAG